jgi:hypothetical protein
MNDDEERKRLEEAAVACVSFAIHISENEQDRDDLIKLSGISQSLLFGVIVASHAFRKQQPPAWVREAQARLTDRCFHTAMAKAIS